MAYAIPDMPSEVKTQIQREKMLEKEAKYEMGLKNPRDGDHTRDVLASIQQKSGAPSVSRGWWSRRLSKVSDVFDLQNQHRMSTPTVWEEPG